MHAIAFAARELAHLLLLVRPAEIEQRAIGAARHLAAAEVDLVLSIRNLLPDRVGRDEAIAGLIDIAELDRVADPETAAVRRLLPGDHMKQGGLAGTVRADHPDDAAGRQAEAERLDQQPVAKGFGDVLRLDHQIAEPWAGRQDDLRRLGRLFPALRDERLI